MGIDNLCSGDEVVVTYPLRRTVREKILSFKNEEFSVTWCGDTLIDIKPPDNITAYYIREVISTATLCL